MKKISKVILFILTALYCFLLLHFKPWTEFKATPRISDIVLAAAVMVILMGLIASAVAMLLGRKEARKAFLFFNLAYLGFGAYVVQVAWTLWIFKTPSLMDRIKASTIPFLLGVVIPIAVIFYFVKLEKK